MAAATLVIADGCDAATVGDAAARLGWSAAPHLPDPAATPGDERVLGAWSRPDGGRLTLHDDGVHRVLVVEGAAATTRRDELARTLPLLDAAAVGRDLAATDPARVARAARAAAWLGDPALAPALSLLRHHPDEIVREEAAAALRATVPALVAHGTSLLQARADAAGGAHPAWPSALPAQDRRQILRWTLRDHRDLPRDGLLATLRAALADPDWECRIGAAIGAARLGLDALGGLVERLELPRVTRGGPLPDDRALLRALHRGCLLELVRRPDPPDAGDPRAADMRHLRACIAGRPTPRRDHCWLLVRSLTEPADDGGEAPLPPGASSDDRGVVHLDGIALAWIPPLEHWLGDEQVAPANPIRPAPGIGGWIAARPLSCAAAGVVGGDAPWQCRLDEARAWCAARSRPGLTWSVPDDACWEQAARGVDGRRFPWGAGLEPGWSGLASPAGATGWGLGAEWTIRAGQAALRGGFATAVPCAQWRPADAMTALLRPSLAWTIAGGSATDRRP